MNYCSWCSVPHSSTTRTESDPSILGDSQATEISPGRQGDIRKDGGPCWALFWNGGAVRCFNLGDKCRYDFLGVPSLWRTSNSHSPLAGRTRGLFQRPASWGAVSYIIFFLTDYLSPGEQIKEVSVLQVSELMQDKSHLYRICHVSKPGELPVSSANNYVRPKWVAPFIFPYVLRGYSNADGSVAERCVHQKLLSNLTH